MKSLWCWRSCAHASWASAAERGAIRISYFAPITGTFSQTGKDTIDGFMLLRGKWATR